MLPQPREPALVNWVSTWRGSCTLSTTLTLFPTGKHHLYQYKTGFSAPLMLCKLKRNFAEGMRLQAYLSCHYNSQHSFSIYFSIFPYLEQWDSAYQNKVPSPSFNTINCRRGALPGLKSIHAKEWLMATILCGCLSCASSANSVSWCTATVSRSEAYSFCHCKHTLLLPNELKQSLRSLPSQPVERSMAWKKSLFK